MEPKSHDEHGSGQDNTHSYTELDQSVAEWEKKVHEAAAYVNKRLGTANLAVVLGSGLNNFTDQLTNATELPYSEIPYMPRTTVSGHSGKLVIGDLDKRKVFLLAGRSHGYEGKSMHQLIFTTKLLQAAGVKVFVATNAAGGAMQGMFEGCLMIIRDHINFWHRNPLIENYDCEDPSIRNPTMNNIYSPRLRQLAKDAAAKLKLTIFEGVYGATSGPTFETPAEVRGFSVLGGDSYGMSTIPESMVAKTMGMEVFAISLITNLAAGLTSKELTHQEVSEVGRKSAESFTNFMKLFLGDIQPLESSAASSAPVFHGQLPLPQPAPVTANQIEEAKQTIHAPVVSSAFFVSQQCHHVLKGISVEKSYSMNQLKHFPVISSFAVKGELVIGTNKSGEKVSLVTHIPVEGLFPEESNYLVQFVAALGATSVYVIATAAAMTSAVKVGDVVLVDDIFDFTTVVPVPETARAQVYHSKYLTVTEIPSISKKGKYGYYPGPSYPTPIESSVAVKVGCDLAGISSPAPIYGARALGLNTGFIVHVTQSSDFVTNSTTSASTVVEEFISHVKAEKAVAVKSYGKSSVSSDRQMTYLFSRPVTQGNYEEIEALAKDFTKSYGPLPKTVVLVDSILEESASRAHHSILSQMKVEKEVDVTKFLKKNNVHVTFGGAKIVLGSFQGKSLAVVHGTDYINSGRPTQYVTLVTRLLGVLKPEKVISLTASYSIDESLKVGSSVMVGDLVGFSQRNPLFGINEDRWGLRFPDASNLFNKSFSQQLTQLSSDKHLNVKTVIFGHTVGPIFESPVNAALYRLMGCHVLGTGMVSDALICCHLKVPFLSVGIVTHALHDSSSVVSVEQFLSLDVMVNHLL